MGVLYNVELIMIVGFWGSFIYNEFWCDVIMKYFFVYGVWSIFNWYVNCLYIKFVCFIFVLGIDISYCIFVWKVSFKFFRVWKYFLLIVYEIVDMIIYYLLILNFDIVELVEKCKYL